LSNGTRLIYESIKMQKAYSERADLTRSGVSMLGQMYKYLYDI
jgi:hypothetical protein